MQNELMQNEQQPKKSGLLSALLMSSLLIAGGVGGGYFFTQQQPAQWAATATFTAPRVVDLGNYFSLFGTYQLVQNDGKADPNLEKTITEQSFAEFKRQLTAAAAKQQFLAQNETIKQIAAAYNQPTEQFVQQLADKLQFDESSNTLRFSLVNPTQAVAVLNEFIAQTTVNTRETLNADLVAKWKFLFQNVKQSAEANLGQSWQGKLNLMRSVQPLDNTLKAYHLAQPAAASATPEVPENLPKALGIGGAIGVLLSLLFVLFRRK